MDTYRLLPKRAKSRVSIESAGTDLIIGSFTFKCIMIAPIINILNEIYEYKFSSVIQMPIINNIANMIFKNPIKYINQDGRPYTENSCVIELAPPPRYRVFLLNLINQTFKRVRAIIKLIIKVSNIILQK